MKEKFYQKSWFMWLMLIFMPPIGIILMWTYQKNYLPKRKCILTTVFLIWTLALSLPSSNIENAALPSEGSIFAYEVNAAPKKTTPKAAKDLEVHFLDVGQGLSILAKSDNQTMIYDGGGRGASSFTVSYLKSQGVTTIDYLISSHYDEDHLAGLIGCLNAFKVKNIICSNYEHDTDLYDSFAQTAANLKIELQHPDVGTDFDFGTGKFTILSPQTISSDSNSNSVAVKLENGNNSFIFTGDATSESEAAMCASEFSLDTDVLSISHHGSATATSWDFLQATTPDYAVISCGNGNSYGHPDKDTMDKLSDMEIPVFRTDKQGTIIAESNGKTITWDQEPCNDYSAGSPSDIGTRPTKTAASKATSQTDTETSSITVWKSATGEKYHTIPDCGRMNPNKATQLSEAEAKALGLEPCKKCF